MEQEKMSIDALRHDCAVKQKKGLHFIMASVVIWAAVLAVHLTGLPMDTKNLLTFCCACPLVPLAFLISKWIHVDFQGKNNPLTKAGLLFSINQILYILIAMWVMNAVPTKMLMVYTLSRGSWIGLPVPGVGGFGPTEATFNS